MNRNSFVFALFATGPAVAAECPGQFFDIPLMDTAKLCSVFDDAKPASLTYLATQPIEVVTNFYQKIEADLTPTQSIKQYTVLTTSNQQYTIVLSPDPHGTQVDLLARF